MSANCFSFWEADLTSPLDSLPGLRPWTLYRGFAPGPHWGLVPNGDYKNDQNLNISHNSAPASRPVCLTVGEGAKRDNMHRWSSFV